VRLYTPALLALCFFLTDEGIKTWVFFSWTKSRSKSLLSGSALIPLCFLGAYAFAPFTPPCPLDKRTSTSRRLLFQAPFCGLCLQKTFFSVYLPAVWVRRSRVVPVFFMGPLSPFFILFFFFFFFFWRPLRLLQTFSSYEVWEWVVIRKFFVFSLVSLALVVF